MSRLYLWGQWMSPIHKVTSDYKRLPCHHDTLIRMDFDWTSGPLAEGLHLYDTGKYFEAHEAWEGVWLKAPEPEKTFLQGLIQVTAACHHLRRGNRLGTTRMLSNALQRLDPRGPEFGGIAVGLLCGDIRDRLNHLANSEATASIQPPRIVPLCL
jgi:predicted metal-dependent hydrolase